MTTTISLHTDVDRRHDFVLLFDVQDGNPTGDPDAGNLPRVDNESMQGLVTDVAIKRRVRDYVDASSLEQARYKIYVQRESYLTETRARVFGEKAEGRQGVHHSEARDWMCQEFFDIRMFGAVMSMREYNAGQVRAPVQLTFARSVDPILPLGSSIARVALERGERPDGQGNDDLEAPAHGTLGRKATGPYVLYLGYGFFNPHFARQTGAVWYFSAEEGGSGQRPLAPPPGTYSSDSPSIRRLWTLTGLPTLPEISSPPRSKRPAPPDVGSKTDGGRRSGIIPAGRRQGNGFTHKIASKSSRRGRRPGKRGTRGGSLFFGVQLAHPEAQTRRSPSTEET